MRRMFTVGLALGASLLGAATSAGAQGYHRPCTSCGPAGTTRTYRTIYPVQYLTRYHDRSVYDHVTRVRNVVDVTRIQPIVHVNDVTRIHHHVIVSVRDVYAYPMQYPVTVAPAPITYLQPSTVSSYGCSCGGDE